MVDASIIICSCNSTEHQIVFLPWVDSEMKYKEVYVHVHLVKRPFWDRLKYGLNYIFGHRCRYGAFDEFIFDKDNVQKLKEVIKFIEEEPNEVDK